MTSRPVGADAPTTVSIAAGPLVGPILRRVVGMLAARADLPLDRLDDAVLVADLIAARAPAHVLHGTVDVAFEPGPRTLSLRVGPLRPGGGDALVDRRRRSGRRQRDRAARRRAARRARGRAGVPARPLGVRGLRELERSGGIENRPRRGYTRLRWPWLLESKTGRSTTAPTSSPSPARSTCSPRRSSSSACQRRSTPAPHDVIVDLTETTFIDSSSLGVLIGAHRRLRRLQGRLVVVCYNDAIVKTFRITGLDGVFTIVGTPRRGAQRRRGRRVGTPPARVAVE